MTDGTAAAGSRPAGPDTDGRAPANRPDGLTRATFAVVWLARAAWLFVAVLGGQAVGAAMDERSRAVQVVGTAGAWVGWAAAAVALAVTGVATLTAARALVPGAAVVAAATGIGGADAGAVLALAVPTAITIALVGSAEFGRGYIQASAYGDEQRFGLRPPLGYLAAGAGSWLVTAAAVVAAPLALAARSWVVAVAATLVAATGAKILPVRWHQLSRRWLVLVPAGVVVHDPVVLSDTLMLPKRTVKSVRLDDAGVAATTAADLTGPTPGLAVEIVLTESTTAVLAATRAHRGGRAIHLSALVVSPSRPGSVIVAARRRALPA